MPYSGAGGRTDSQAFPYRQITVLGICRISEPIAFMSILPYIYYMVKSFHITEDEERLALYAGMVTSVFALAEAMSSSIWGRLSDKYGRKPILLCGLIGTGISMMIFGFAQNLQTALIARALGGLLNGNIGVLQTTVAEVVTNEAHFARGFSIMPAVWCIGAIIGSALGGALADPVHNYPGKFGPGSIFEQFPYLLPNIASATFIVFSVVVGILFLEETHEDMKNRKDMGIQIGRWITGCFRKTPRAPLTGRKDHYPSETYVLLHDNDQPPDYRSAASSPGLGATSVGLPPPYQSIDSVDGAVHTNDFTLALDDGAIESLSHDESAIKHKSSVWQAFNTQMLLIIIGYGIVAYHTISAEQLLPVLFSLPESDTPPKLPFWFTGGFALPTKTIGGLLSSQGIISMVVTVNAFPYISPRLGSVTTFRMVAFSYPLLYLLVPYLTLVPDNLRMAAIYVVLFWKVTLQALAIPAIQVMIPCAAPKRALGTFNGVAQSSASFARAIGPTLSGLLQAAGLAHGTLGLPWWFNAFVALLGAVLSLFMVEQYRRSLDPEKSDHEESVGSIPPGIDSDINAALVAAESAQDMSRPASPILVRLSMDNRRNARRNSKS